MALTQNTSKLEEILTIIDNLPEKVNISGNKAITTTSQVDVTNYATAQVVDSNLKAENIKNGVSILGITGTAAGDSNSSTNFKNFIEGTITDSTIKDISLEVTAIKGSAFIYCPSLTTASFPACTIIKGSAFAYCPSLTTISFPVCSSIGYGAFAGCSNLTAASFPVCSSIWSYAFLNCYSLTTASFPACTYIGDQAFAYCSNLTTISFPACTSIKGSAFLSCSSLTTISFPVCSSIWAYAFLNCHNLTTASFPACTYIYGNAFQSCYNLISLYLTNTTKVCTLAASNAFSSTPIGGYSASAKRYGSIYVPASLLASYKAATNWRYFSSRFVGV